ncbi:MAG: hypothetical protein CIT03_05810 [Methanobacterium sp.]|nr:MAG: hypothetical protein CIT03_05810 [Methanobacterium sp.]
MENKIFIILYILKAIYNKRDISRGLWGIKYSLIIVLIPAPTNKNQLNVPFPEFKLKYCLFNHH